MVLISVVIPTYNRSTLVERAILSVDKQTYPNIELIIVDDGSTDDTKVRVAELAGQVKVPLRYIYQENRGAASARNTGIRAAGSDTICFLDSDDRFLPDKVSIQAKSLLESGKHISHTREVWYRRGQHLNQKRKHYPPEGLIFQKCLRMCVVGMSTVMIRRELFDRYGWFDEKLPCCEDFDFWLRLSIQESFHLVNVPLTIKDGGREDQLSVTYRMGMDRYRIMSIVNLLESGRLSPEQSVSAVEELGRKCHIYGNGCLKHGKTVEGNYYLKIPDRFVAG